MQLSAKAIKDLRLELRKQYGSSVDLSLTDSEISENGIIVLNLVAQKINQKERHSF